MAAVEGMAGPLGSRAPPSPRPECQECPRKQSTIDRITAELRAATTRHEDERKSWEDLRTSLDARLGAAEEAAEHAEYEADLARTRHDETREALDRAILRATALQNQVEVLTRLAKKSSTHAHDSHTAAGVPRMPPKAIYHRPHYGGASGGDGLARRKKEIMGKRPYLL